MSRKALSTTLITRVASCLQQYCLVSNGDRVIVAVSGGSDSLALLHILHSVELPLALTAVYIDHGLRPAETPVEQANIDRYCSLLKIPFFVRNVDVVRYSAQNKCSPEESARILRYEALEKIRRDQFAEVVAVGHTADDQVEEFFIRLIRGSSVRGLSGMLPRQGGIVRPLLFEKKETLQRYLEQQRISWCIDSSNMERRFLRNRVRLDLLPFLEAGFNRSMRKTTLNTMDMLQVEDDYLEQRTAAVFKRCVNLVDDQFYDSPRTRVLIRLPLFLRLHPALARRILEKCLWLMESRPSYAKIKALHKLIEDADSGSEIHLAGGVRAIKGSADLVLLRPLKGNRLRGSSPSLPSISLSIPATGIYPVPELDKELVVQQQVSTDDTMFAGDMLQVDMRKIVFPLLLRSSVAGERFHPCNGPGTRKISRYFNDRKIPVRERPAWPVLVSNGTIIALPGLQIDHAYRVTETTTEVLTIVWRDGR